MFRKLFRVLAILSLIAVGGTAIGYFGAQPDHPAQAPASTAGVVQIVKPIDLSGEWQSVESHAGTKFLGHIKNNTVHIEMVANGGYSGLWYGTFDILQPGENEMLSSAIEDENYFVLSSAETKNFIYQDGSLVFDFSVMGVRTTIEMKRV